MMGIVVSARILLRRLEQPGTDVGEEGVAVGKEAIDGLGAGTARLVRKQRRGRPAVDDVERGGAQGRVMG
jgi:hypothetical protein